MKNLSVSVSARWAGLVLLLALAALASPAQESAPAPSLRINRAGTETYEQILARVKATDSGVDYKEFRLAYADSPQYRPSADPEIQQTMFSALSSKDHAKAAELAESILKDRYVDIYGHQVAAIAYREMGDRANSGIHGSLARELMRSIVESGDGNTPETAMVLISEEEEAIILQSLQLKVLQQELMNENGHTYDRVEAVDANDVSMSIYFNLDVPVIKVRQALAARPK